MKSLIPILTIAVGVALVGCGPADDVEVLALPPLEYASAEARLGLPELEGTWRFAGWEVTPGDSAALTQTFPSFGELTLDTQRLDSVAGMFSLYGGNAPVVGEVRRDGWVALVTLNGREPTAFVTGRYARDTLWVEMTSVVSIQDWPRGARAAFVRGAAGNPIAWLRGTVPGAVTTAATSDSLFATAPVAPVSTDAGATDPVSRTPPATRVPPTPLGTPTRRESPDSPAPRAAPPPPAPPRPPPPPPPPAPRPEPDPPIRLLGEPVTRDGSP